MVFMGDDLNLDAAAVAGVGGCAGDGDAVFERDRPQAVLLVQGIVVILAYQSVLWQ